MVIKMAKQILQRCFDMFGYESKKSQMDLFTENKMNYKNIPELETMSAQEVFDKALNHVKSTGKASVNKNGFCCYSGIGCAASPFLIKSYKKNADARKNKTWWDLVATSTVTSKHDLLIIEIQGAHDDASRGQNDFISTFLKYMQNVASRFDLKMS